MWFKKRQITQEVERKSTTTQETAALYPSIPELEQETEEKFIKLVQLVQFKCRHGINIAKEIDDTESEQNIYNKQAVQKIFVTCMLHANEIKDDYYNSAALHNIANLLTVSKQQNLALEIISQIKVDFIQEKANSFFLANI